MNTTTQKELKIFEIIEYYGFECEAGPLDMCEEYLSLKSRYKRLLEALQKIREQLVSNNKTGMSTGRGMCWDEEIASIDEAIKSATE